MQSLSSFFIVSVWLINIDLVQDLFVFFPHLPFSILIEVQNVLFVNVVTPYIKRAHVFKVKLGQERPVAADPLPLAAPLINTYRSPLIPGIERARHEQGYERARHAGEKARRDWLSLGVRLLWLLLRQSQ